MTAPAVRSAGLWRSENPPQPLRSGSSPNPQPWNKPQQQPAVASQVSPAVATARRWQGRPLSCCPDS